MDEIVYNLQIKADAYMRLKDYYDKHNDFNMSLQCGIRAAMIQSCILILKNADNFTQK